MNSLPKEEDIDNEKENMSTDNVLPFVRPQADPKKPEDGDWLTPMEVGTVFWFSKKNDIHNYMVGEAQVIFKSEGLTKLADTNQRPPMIFVVRNQRFCNQHDCLHILGRVIYDDHDQNQEETQETGDADDQQRNRPDQSDGLAEPPERP